MGYGDTDFELCGKICHGRQVDVQILKKIAFLAVEIAREGREGRKIGTMFVLGDERNVLARSKCLILDPLYGHPLDKKHIEDGNLRESVKELAQLDGAFVVSEDGVFVSACRYIDASSRKIELPLGFGTRHMAAASITLDTDSVAIVVSESSMVRIFDDGELVTEILPEVWLLGRHGIHLKGPFTEEKQKDVMVFSKK